MIETFLSGVIAGAAYGLTGFGKKSGQTFDYKKFGRTVIIGGIAGGLSTVVNMPIDQVQVFVIQAGGIAIVENLLVVAYRKIKKLFSKE